MQRAAITDTAVASKLAAAGLAASDGDIRALAAFANLLLRWNRVYNLTAIRDPEQVIERHLIESLALGELLRGRRIADVGSGAGLPGVPLAITEPARRFTLIEPRAKRVRFLRHVLGELALENTLVEHSRAEDLRCTQPFDTVLARAVAPLAQLVHLIRPLTSLASIVIVLTGARAGGQRGGFGEGFTVRSVDRTIARRVRGAIVLLERTEE